MNYWITCKQNRKSDIAGHPAIVHKLERYPETIELLVSIGRRQYEKNYNDVGSDFCDFYYFAFQLIYFQLIKSL